MIASEVRIPSGDATLAGTLLEPDTASPGAVLLLGGTFSDLRDGDPDPALRPGMPPHGMYRLVAEALVADGWIVLRFDRRGSGASSGERPDRATEVADALAAWRWLATRAGGEERVAMVGESAGAYVAGRLCAHGARPRAVVLQGALARPIESLMAVNAGRARRYWERGPDERDWMRRHAPAAHRLARVQPALLDALRAGRAAAELDDDLGSVRWPVSDVAYDQDAPPLDQLRHIRCPVLVLHAADDLNVPVEDAFRTASELWRCGNRDVEVRILPRADHSFQSTPDDPEERLRERLSFASFLRPFHLDYPGAIVRYLAGRL